MLTPISAVWDTLFEMAIDLPISGLKETLERPKLPDTTGFTADQIYDLYAGYVKMHGSAEARQALEDGKQVIVALRLETDTRSNEGRGVYDDRMAIISKGTDGSKHAQEFSANTEPSAQYEQRGKVEVEKIVKNKNTGKYVKIKVKKTEELYDPVTGKKVRFSKNDGQDVDANKRKDAGRLAQGTYKFNNMGSATFLGAKYLGSSNDQVAQRDVNHDGKFTSADSWTGKDGAQTSTHSGNFAMYIHKGGKSNTWSAGCQTLPPEEHKKFFKGLDKKQKEYYYVLVNVE
jgi:hypothetical protein